MSYTKQMALNKHTIDNKTIRFKSDFNESLESYYKIIKNVNVLIFDENIKKEIYSKFNKPIKLTSKIKHLTFGFCFNQPIILTPKIKYLIFGYSFNQPIILTPKITHLTFGGYFNQPIILTSKITHLVFEGSFNRPMILTPKITYLTFGYYFNQPIILTPKITHLTFGFCFNQPIILTPKITHLKINCNNYWMIDNMPNNIKYMTLWYDFVLPLSNVTNNIKNIETRNSNYKYKRLIQYIK